MRLSYEDWPIKIAPQGWGYVAWLDGLEDGPRFHARDEIEAGLGLVEILQESQWGHRVFTAGGLD